MKKIRIQCGTYWSYYKLSHYDSSNFLDPNINKYDKARLINSCDKKDPIILCQLSDKYIPCDK